MANIGRTPRRRKRALRTLNKKQLRPRLGREDWIAAARAVLLVGGVNGVKIGHLAKRLGTSRVGFYWHFTSRVDLLRDLLKLWESATTAPFEDALKRSRDADPIEDLLTILGVWVEETDFSPAFDRAVRDWARSSREAAAAVGRVDARRIEILHKIFKDLGFHDLEALVRARITYYHQVGYYALDEHEPRDLRRDRIPLNCKILSGLPADEFNDRFAVVMRNRAGLDAGLTMRS
jgi:AcrR family transcriptional regulator